MHKLEKAILEADTTPHEHEEAVQSLFMTADSEVGHAIQEARAAGVTWPAIIQLLVQYGPQFAAVLQAILAAWHSPPPAAQATAESQQPNRRHKATEE